MLIAAVLTAPKSSWSKRVNASSGGLHPVESYVFVPPQLSSEIGTELEGSATLFHYSPQFHGLEHRRSIPAETWAKVVESLEIPSDALLVAITSVNWREIWKYGERAFRYSQLDIGHSVGALVLTCLLMGWQSKPLNMGGSLAGLSDEEFSSLLGFETSSFESGEEEYPAVLLCISPSKEAPLGAAGTHRLAEELIQTVASTKTIGKPNQQSWTVRMLLKFSVK